MAKVNAIAGRDDKPVAVIGDSTFFHSGMTGLMSMAYNGGNALVIIMDNRTTGMTGGQENPGTGETLQGIPARQVEMVPLVKALGIDNVCGTQRLRPDGNRSRNQKRARNTGAHTF